MYVNEFSFHDMPKELRRLFTRKRLDSIQLINGWNEKSPNERPWDALSEMQCKRRWSLVKERAGNNLWEEKSVWYLDRTLWREHTSVIDQLFNNTFLFYISSILWWKSISIFNRWWMSSRIDLFSTEQHSIMFGQGHLLLSKDQYQPDVVIRTMRVQHRCSMVNVGWRPSIVLKCSWYVRERHQIRFTRSLFVFASFSSIELLMKKMANTK